MTTYEKPEYHDQSNIAFIISFFLSLISVLFCGLYGNPFNIYFGIMLLAELFLAFSAISVQHSHPVIHVLIHIAAFLLPVITFIFQPDWQSAGTASFAYFVLVSSAKIKHKKSKSQNLSQTPFKSEMPKLWPDWDVFPRYIPEGYKEINRTVETLFYNNALGWEKCKYGEILYENISKRRIRMVLRQ